jgi:adenylate cyclase
MANGRRPVSLRWSLLRSFLLLVLISSLSLFAMMQYRAAQSERELSVELTKVGLEEASEQLDRFLNPARIGSELAIAWGRDGLIDLSAAIADEPGKVTTAQIGAITRLNRLLLPYLKAHPVISSINVGNARGEGWLLLRLDDGRLRNRLVARDTWGATSLWLDVDHDGTPAGETWETLDYDPRIRPWYRERAGWRDGDPYWTEAYLLATTGDLGITVSNGWQRDGVDHVVAFDVLLTTLSDFTLASENMVSKQSLQVVMDDRRRMLGLPRDPRYRDPSVVRADLLKHVAELETRVVHASVKAAQGEPEALTRGILNFDFDGETWWAAVQDYALQKERNLRVAVLIPASDLVGEITRLRIGLMISTLIALVAALVFALFLTRSYSRPLESLAGQSQRIRELDFSESEPVVANVREVRELAEAQAQSLAAVESFSRYVPVEVVRELVAEGDVARIGGQSRDMTLLFSDIADFTRISEGLEPQALADHMASYFDELIGIIQTNAGTVDKLVGDAIVAFWGAPRPDTDHAAGAVAAALACRSRLADLNAAWRQEGLPPLATRFGLATGSVIVGNFGAPDRLAYTVLGDRVNLASRLEGLNKAYGTEILAAGETVAACGDAFVWRRLDRVAVKGHKQPTWVHELIGTTDAVDAATLARARAYEAAWESYAERGFDDAVARLDALLAEAADTASQRLRARCAALATRPLGSEWDAVYRPDTK